MSGNPLYTNRGTPPAKTVRLMPTVPSQSKVPTLRPLARMTTCVTGSSATRSWEKIATFVSSPNGRADTVIGPSVCSSMVMPPEKRKRQSESAPPLVTTVMGLAGSMVPSCPSAPGGPSGPAGPCGPCAPCGPVAPSAPSAPSAPGGPVGPTGPVGPGTPCGPGAPSAPSAPSAPGGPAGRLAPTMLSA